MSPIHTNPRHQKQKVQQKQPKKWMENIPEQVFSWQSHNYLFQNIRVYSQVSVSRPPFTTQFYVMKEYKERRNHVKKERIHHVSPSHSRAGHDIHCTWIKSLYNSSSHSHLLNLTVATRQSPLHHTRTIVGYDLTRPTRIATWELTRATRQSPVHLGTHSHPCDWDT